MKATNKQIITVSLKKISSIDKNASKEAFKLRNNSIKVYRK